MIRALAPGTTAALRLSAALLGLLVVAVGPTGCAPAPNTSPPATDPLSATGSLQAAHLLAGTDTSGFARATAPLPFHFPDDHGAHPSFRTEWWYLTGIVDSAAAGGRRRRFGYQFTIFRQALTPDRAPRGSSWATRDLYMSHLAIADLDGDSGSRGVAADARERFEARQRFARDGLGLAGAKSAPFEVWVESWRMRGPAAGEDIFPLALDAVDHAGSTLGLSLSLAAGRGPIPQGDRGLSVKGAGAGNASFYYSCTRLPTAGRLTIHDQSFEVQGMSWLDREWSTSALDPGVMGWDWLGAHLDDGRDLMFYRLRGADGRMGAASRATLIAPDGSTRVFSADAFTLTPRGQWRSRDGRGRYPAGFQLTIPGARLDVVIEPLLADQELLLGVRYWEGAVRVSGSANHKPVTGAGYLELTGYVR